MAVDLTISNVIVAVSPLDVRAYCTVGLRFLAPMLAALQSLPHPLAISRYVLLQLTR
jgi:hypothetical protein